MLIHELLTVLYLVGEFVSGQDVQTLTHTLSRTMTSQRTTTPPPPPTHTCQPHVTSTARASQHDVTTSETANDGEIEDRLQRYSLFLLFFNF